MLKWLKSLFEKDTRPFTVACDISMFWNPINTREQLFHITGLRAAKKFAHRWVWDHPAGQARVLEGHLNWKNQVES